MGVKREFHNRAGLQSRSAVRGPPVGRPSRPE